VGEVTGGGGVGALAGGGAARGVAGSSARRWGRQGRDVGQCEVGWPRVGMRGVRSRGVDRVVRGRMGDAGSYGWRGRGGCARGVSRLGARGSVGRLDR
jgi:hypothetical protein